MGHPEIDWRDLALRLARIERLRRCMARDPAWQELWRIVSDDELDAALSTDGAPADDERD